MKKLIKLTILLFLFTIIFFACKNKTKENNSNISDNNQLNTNEELDSFTVAYNNFLNDSTLFNASVSLYFYDDSTKQTIIDLNSNLALVPASTMKLFTTATALQVLGASKQFSTKLQYDGSISGNVLNGNIYIKGGGDPTLGSKYFSTGSIIESWATEIKNLGIDSITGYIFGDATYFEEDYIPTTWSYGEIGEYYCTPACGLTIYDNQYDLTFYAGKKGRSLALNMNPHIPNFFYDNKTVTIANEKNSTYIISIPYTTEIILKGGVPGNGSYTITGSNPDPAFLASYELYEKLKSKNIKIGQTYSTIRRIKKDNDSVYNSIINKNRTAISSKSSAAVSAIVANTNLRSNNLFAETLLSHIGINYFSHGSAESGARGVLKYLTSIGIDTRGMTIFDGSGISRYNTVTTKQLVSIIKYMKSSPNASIFYNSLPSSGESGTLSGFCDGTIAEGKIRAKTGTMSNVRSYAGYVTTNSGKTLMFAIIVNNHNCTNPELKVKLENLMIKIVEYK